MKLVIFDIDGTLITPVRPLDNLQRFRHSIKRVFGVDIGEISVEKWKQGNFNGKGDRYILWELVKHHGITRDALLDRIGEIGDAFVEHFETIKHGGPSYAVIPEAKQLVDAVIAADHISEGVLTGNLGPSASWKLRVSGFPNFAFGVYGHEADAREDLARLLIPKAKIFFGQDIHPRDIVIIGDTVNDVTCARAIGATVIIVATGWNVHKTEFSDNPPDLHVDSLMDEQVLKLLGLG